MGLYAVCNNVGWHNPKVRFDVHMPGHHRIKWLKTEIHNLALTEAVDIAEVAGLVYW